jgi:hypothetical protein
MRRDEPSQEPFNLVGTAYMLARGQNRTSVVFPGAHGLDHCTPMVRGVSPLPGDSGPFAWPHGVGCGTRDRRRRTPRSRSCEASGCLAQCRRAVFGRGRCDRFRRSAGAQRLRERRQRAGRSAACAPLRVSGPCRALHRSLRSSRIARRAKPRPSGSRVAPLRTHNCLQTFAGWPRLDSRTHSPCSNSLA